ncbi:MAG: hypothetical protein MPK62_03755, partial [Alphaproteobacteria bacterium]|nr:hypothetical protein [Alphaproteobacteria bacterium]
APAESADARSESAACGQAQRRVFLPGSSLFGFWGDTAAKKEYTRRRPRHVHFGRRIFNMKTELIRIMNMGAQR